MTIQTIQASTIGSLIDALSQATGGETIQLAPGDYGAVTLNRFNFAVPVTIVGGSFSAMVVTVSSGLNFEGTKVNFVPDASSTSDSQAIRVWSSDNIHFNHVTLVGGVSVNGVDPSATAADSTGNVLGYPVGKGINFASSTNSSITNSDISMFAKGVVLAGGHDLLIDGNNIHNLRTTPISGSVESNLTISNNHSWDSNPWQFGAQDHGDRIHIWTDGAAITGLVIANNTLDQGAGAPMLGIYLDDNGAGLGFINAVITGNTLIDGQGQGVLLEHVSGTVSNNTLIWSGYGVQYSNTPRFDVNAGSSNIVFKDNNGPVTIAAGSTNLNFVRQAGTISEDTAMSSADRDTINIDNMVITAHNSFTLDTTKSDLYFQGGTGDFVGTGNAMANHIVGGVGNDTLIGKGGADILDGRAGDDTYIVDNAGQTIIDSGGIDLVKSTTSWTLQTGLENLTYIGTGGATLTGNSSANIIIGGSGADRLVGGGGWDTLQGGLGNDTYVIDNIYQTITDTGGVDTIETGLNWTLQTGIENLTLTGAALTATGNSSANILTGNALNNVLDGKAGADTMYGGAGNDTYIVDNAGDKTLEVVNGVDAGGADIVKASVATWTLATGIETLIYTGTAAFTGTGNGTANAITGGNGNDSLNGMAGNDTLNGGGGNDVLNGGVGVDTLTGGTGNDTFVFAYGQSNGDAITDFGGNGTAVGDVIELRGWGEGSTFTNVLANAFVIHDGITGRDEVVTIQGRVDPSDVVFTQVVARTVVVAAASQLLDPSVVDPTASDAKSAIDDTFSSDFSGLLDPIDNSALTVFGNGAPVFEPVGSAVDQIGDFDSAAQHLGSVVEHQFLVIA